MTRQSKQSERRAVSPYKRQNPRKKTGPIKDNLANGYKAHANAIDGDFAKSAFVPKIK